MEDLPIGSEVVLKVVETKEADCTGCFFDEIANIINIYVSLMYMTHTLENPL